MIDENEIEDRVRNEIADQLAKEADAFRERARKVKGEDRTRLLLIATVLDRQAKAIRAGK